MSDAIRTLSEFQQERMVMTYAHSLLMSVQELARKNGVHHVPVMHSDRLVGVVCTCDMMLAPPDTQVGEIMKEPITMSPDRSIEEAAQLMKDRAVGSVVLVNGELPCGIVTRGDVFAHAPGAALAADLPRCSCCGIARHLRTNEEGTTLCIFCQSGAV